MGDLIAVPRYESWLMTACPSCGHHVAIFVQYNDWFRNAPHRDIWMLICSRCLQLVTTTPC
jgi:hypothetical protein